MRIPNHAESDLLPPVRRRRPRLRSAGDALAGGLAARHARARVGASLAAAPHGRPAAAEALSGAALWGGKPQPRVFPADRRGAGLDRAGDRLAFHAYGAA